MENTETKIEVVETTKPVDGLTVTTYTDNTTKIEVSQELQKSMFETITNFDKKTEDCGLCEFIGKKINCEFFSKHPITGRATGHVKIGGRYLDLDALKKLFNVAKDSEGGDGEGKKRRGKKDRDTRTRVQKLEAARDWFIKSIEEITLTKFEDITNLDTVYNKGVEIAKEQDAKNSVGLTSINSIATASDNEKATALSIMLGISIEEAAAQLKQIEALKQTTK